MNCRRGGSAGRPAGRNLVLLTVAVAGEELVDAAGGVDEFLLAGEEGVGGGGDFQLHQGVGLAVDFDSFLSGNSRVGDEDFIVRHIFENYFAIVGRMDVFFHFISDVVVVCKSLGRPLVGRPGVMACKFRHFSGNSQTFAKKSVAPGAKKTVFRF